MVIDNRLTQAITHRNQRQWQQAIDLYNAYLEEYPEDTETLHELAITAVKAQQYHEAHRALLILTTLQPDSAVFQNHFANVLKQLGYLQESEQAYKKALQLDTNFVEAYNNLGILYFNQGMLDKAAQYYQQALTISPGFTDALYNLGICSVRQNQDELATEYFGRLLQITPHHTAAHYQLGKIYVKRNQLDLAIPQFAAILAINEKIPEIHNNLANCYLQQQAWPQARIHYEKALDLDPNNFEACYNLAIVSEAFANIDLAIQYYQKAIAIKNNDFATHNNLGIAYLKRQNLGFALKHFEIALRLQPDNENLRYNIDAIKQDKRLEAAPSNYIKNLFDSYANHFETHIRESLDYQVPEKLLVAFEKNIKRNWIPAFAGTTERQCYQILDAGCGTGLAGEIFKPYAKKLIGVDLSDKMIELAKAKNIYDELVVADIESYLQTQVSTSPSFPRRREPSHLFNIILAADVLVYIGKLDTFIKQCRNALKHRGLLIFSTEICENADYQILPSGRFAHSENYLKKLAKQHRFKIIYNEVIQARMQYDKPVMGRIIVMRKKII